MPRFFMRRYYVNRNAQYNGDHEVHVLGCVYFPSIGNSEYLGQHVSCHTAVREAKRKGYNANGCYYCSRECHTS